MHIERGAVRVAAAAISAVMAAIYYLIGLGVLMPVTVKPQDGMLMFGALAGSAFALGAVLLLAFDRRLLWVVGAVFQVFVFWAYISIAPQREPPFETWGILLRILQVPLFAALVYLAVRDPHATEAPTASS